MFLRKHLIAINFHCECPLDAHTLRILDCSEFGVLIKSDFNLSGSNKGLNKKMLAGILVGCTVFILVMIILGVAILRKKKLEKPGKFARIPWNR